MTGAEIERVLAVIDTREYEEVGDRWVPIPGSGTAHNCSRCGRSHEVHAEVLLADGTRATVGTGCMRAESAEVQSRIRSAASRSKRLRALVAELAARRAALIVWNAEYAAVAGLPLPPVTTETEPATPTCRLARLRYRMGDAIVWGLDLDPQAERIACVTEAWRSLRMVERGFSASRPWFDETGLERRISKLTAAAQEALA